MYEVLFDIDHLATIVKWKVFPKHSNRIHPLKKEIWIIPFHSRKWKSQQIYLEKSKNVVCYFYKTFEGSEIYFDQRVLLKNLTIGPLILQIDPTLGITGDFSDRLKNSAYSEAIQRLQLEISTQKCKAVLHAIYLFLLERLNAIASR